MKILVIPSWYPPNGGWFFKEHAMAIASEGHQVDVLAGLHTSLRRTSPLRWISDGRLTVREGQIREITRLCPIIPFSERLNYHSWIRMMLKFYDEYSRKWGHPDIIQVHSSLWAGVVASQIRKKYRVPYIITEHRSRFVYNSGEAANMFRPWYSRPLQEAFKGAEAIVTVSKSLHDKIIDIYPKASEKLDVIYNMVDTDFFTLPAITNPHIKPFKLFCLAHLEAFKGIDTLLVAFAMLNTKYAGEFTLHIGGDGTQKESLLEQATTLGIQKNVIFSGRLNREQVRDAFWKADAFVLPSRFEAFGVVFIEAMSAGIPVIGTKAGGPESFIKPHTGALVLPDQPAELAETIYRLKSSYHTYSHEAIRGYAISNFSRKKIAEEYLNLYQKVVSKK